MTTPAHERFARLVGVAIRDRREVCDITQTELGEAICRSKHAISRIERGKCEVSMSTLWRIAEALVAWPSYFVQRAEDAALDAPAEEER